MRIIAALIVCAGLGFSAETNQLVGSWKLVSYSDTPENGKPYFRFGSQPTGEFTFTLDGHFSAQACTDPKGPLPAALPPKGFDDMTSAGAVTSCLSYSGTYNADPATGALSYRLQEASAPVDLNSDVSCQEQFVSTATG